jgi:uncharacterized membrane protein required for colicin V production
MVLYQFYYICLAIILILGVIGYAKGAISTLLDLVGLIASFIIAWMLAPNMGAWLMNAGGLGASLTAQLSNTLLQSSGASGLSSSLTNSLGMDQSALAGAVNSGITSNLQAFLQPVAQEILTVVAFFVLLILLNVVISLLRRFFRHVDKLPVLGTLNRLAGLALGVGMGCLIAAMVVTGAVVYAAATGDTTLAAHLSAGSVTAVVSRAIQ